MELGPYAVCLVIGIIFGIRIEKAARELPDE